MNELIDIVTEKNGKPITTSRKVAQAFEKEHKNVLRDIENLLTDDEFSRLNFELSSYKSRGKVYPEYILTKNGFTLLVMGYTGDKAMKFKKAYICQFDAMENFIKSIQTAKMDYPALTRAIEQAHDEPKFYHFSNEINMINRIVLGVDAKHFKEENGIDGKENSIRPFLTAEQIRAVEELQRIDIGLLIANMAFEQRKAILTAHHNRILCG